jgi:glucose-6-phosphate 1-dehydrogenase
MAGDGAVFTREDAVEAAWTEVDPVLKTHHEVRPYHRGSWGPKEADAIIAADGGWHNPGPSKAAEARCSLRPPNWTDPGLRKNEGQP